LNGREQNGDGRERVHGRAEYQWPQLELVRPDLDGLPPLEPPDGYEIRDYQDGDAEAWGKIMTEAFNPFWDAARFRRLMLPHFGFSPDRVFFVCRDGAPVGSASAFLWPGTPGSRGYIHMVGVLEEHCGHGLGHCLTVACLLRLKEEGFDSAMLQTESFRTPAIKHYLRLGFRPTLAIEGQRETWRGLLSGMEGEDFVREIDLESLPVMGRLSFWWRSALVGNYTGWLNLRSDFNKSGG